MNQTNSLLKAIGTVCTCYRLAIVYAGDQRQDKVCAIATRKAAREFVQTPSRGKMLTIRPIDPERERAR